MAEDKKKEIDVTVIEVTEEYLKEKLYEIRGKRVLLDADLAEIYGYTNKRFNEQKGSIPNKSKENSFPKREMTVVFIMPPIRIQNLKIINKAKYYSFVNARE